MSNVLFSGTLLAAFLGGLVALLAPCCISVMLPAYLATGFRQRTGILAATLIFALGVATVIVPIGLGASALISIVSGQHRIVFAIAATLMLIGGIAMLLGWKPQLPMIPGRAPTGEGYASVYGLGVFSGAATSCCAPVLIGVSILSGSASSFPAAAAVAITYVMGMVAPLAFFALIWDKREWGASKWAHGRQITLHLGRIRRTMAFGTAASGFLLLGMSLLAYIQAVQGPGMGASGWLVKLAADLQHVAINITHSLTWIPGWVFALLLVLSAFFMIRQANRMRSRPNIKSKFGDIEKTSTNCCTSTESAFDSALESEIRK